MPEQLGDLHDVRGREQTSKRVGVAEVVRSARFTFDIVGGCAGHQLPERPCLVSERLSRRGIFLESKWERPSGANLAARNEGHQVALPSATRRLKSNHLMGRRFEV